MSKEWTEKLGYKVIFMTIRLINLFMSPLVFMLIWNWFITKLGLVHIDYWLSFGIMLLINFAFDMNAILNKNNYDNSDYTFDPTASFAKLFVIFITIVMAFIVHLFV
ncbi:MULTISPECIES: hypothetical protein [Convivina]|uniref:Uncharacterized protein n=2 Tax=Convivina TaxID=1697027 RepID=A0A2U1D3F7_9LACO|nr:MULTISPECIES: hypothetical protein [Convivina]PVY82092.1 hypothetical protein C7384_1171 [Convivina intestini]CAH1857295.1 hypothetical protein R077815_01560 [Convivina sp. LMG 32447]CAH1857516.1 hypothetical protein LMG032447_01584 [Convivina sp. LMG 32447]CAH1857610.1 hypothetical protein R077811_01636 [Convivina intestini]